MTFGTGLKPPYKKIAQRGEYVATIIWLYRLYQAFPFNFSSTSVPVIDFNWNTIAKIVLIMAMIGTGIAILVEFIRWVGVVTGNGQSKPWPTGPYPIACPASRYRTSMLRVRCQV